MARRAADLPHGPSVVVLNPDEDCSPESFRAFIDELLSGPEADLETLDAAAVLGVVRAEANVE